MKHKIDKYFKQKLNISQQPPADAWDFIQNNLPKEKEKKRIFPIWVRLSGIAVSLLLMTGLGYWLGSHNNSVSGKPEFVIIPSGQLSNHPDSDLVNEKNTKGDIPGYLDQNPQSQIENSSTNQLSTGKPGNQIYSYNQNSQNNHLYFTNSENRNNSDESNFSSFTKSTLKTFNELILDNLPAINNSWDNLDLHPKVFMALSTLDDAQLERNKNEQFLLVSDIKPNEEKEKKKKKRTDFDRFYISAFASPLAFNTFVGNSMLADEMSQYHTENNVTLAYGVKAAYSLNPKLKIRTGVSVVGLEQITNDVPLAVDVTGRGDLTSTDKINNINYNGNVRIDNNSMAVSLADAELLQKTGYGNMQQQTSYIEIPLEAELSLFETNSIGISATGGGSTWVLSKNKIYVHTEDYTQELGKANNLNNVTFSANAGLKFDMNLTETVKLNVEPNFRYLFNPVNNIEKYNPYTVGVNAGVSISLK